MKPRPGGADQESAEFTHWSELAQRQAAGAAQHGQPAPATVSDILELGQPIVARDDEDQLFVIDPNHEWSAVDEAEGRPDRDSEVAVRKRLEVAKARKRAPTLMELSELSGRQSMSTDEYDADSPVDPTSGTVVRQTGGSAFVIVKEGTLRVGDRLMIAGLARGVVTALYNSRGFPEHVARPGAGEIEVIGLSPNVPAGVGFFAFPATVPEVVADWEVERSSLVSSRGPATEGAASGEEPESGDGVPLVD